MLSHRRTVVNSTGTDRPGKRKVPACSAWSAWFLQPHGLAPFGAKQGGVKNHEKYAKYGKYVGQGLSRGSFPQDASDGARLYRPDSLMMVGCCSRPMGSRIVTPSPCILSSGSTCRSSASRVLVYPSGAAGQALTCPPWCIRTPPGCPPPHAGDAKLRPACPASVVIILLETTCPSYGQVRKSIMTSLPSENETYLVSPACGGDVEAVRPRQRGHEKQAGSCQERSD